MKDDKQAEFEGVFKDNREKLAVLLDKNGSNRSVEFSEKLKSMPEDFGGPSIYFHEQAIIAAREKQFFVKDRKKFKEHLKMVYAVLPAWGMHRMGETDTKIIPYDQFCENIYNHIHNPDYNNLVCRYRSGELTLVNAEADEVAGFILSLKVSASEARLVSSSKTLHHIFPDLIPPVDRAYTIRFMTQKTPFDKKNAVYNINSKSEPWFAKTFLEQIQSFLNEDKQRKHTIKLLSKKGNGFNTSIPKVLDNLIIAFVKLHTKEKEKQKK